MRLPDEGNVRETRPGSGTNGSAAPERSLGWRQSVRGQRGSGPGPWDQPPLPRLCLLRPAGPLWEPSGSWWRCQRGEEWSLLPMGGGHLGRVPSPDVRATWASQLRKGPEPGLRGDTARARGRTPSGSGVTGAGRRPGTQKVWLSLHGKPLPLPSPKEECLLVAMLGNDVSTAGPGCLLWAGLCSECLSFQPRDTAPGPGAGP